MVRAARSFALAILGPIASASAAPCPADPANLGADLDDAGSFVVSGDALAFERSVAIVTEDVRCLRVPVSPEEAARVHGVLALWQWARRDDEAAKASLLAARQAAPSLSLDERLFPAGSTLRLAWEQAAPAGATQRVRLPPARKVWFDGVLTPFRPTGRPSLVQIAGRDGLPEVGVVLPAAARLPEPTWVRRTRRDLAIAAGVLGGGALGLYGGAWGAWGGFQATPADDVAALRRNADAANGLSASASVLTASAVAMGIAAAVLR